MDINDLLRFWVAAFACATVAATILGLAWFRNRQRVRRLEDYIFGQEASPARDAALGQLTQQVETLAAAVERLEHGQEFLSRLVAGTRHPLPAASDRSQAVTPH